MKNSHSNILLVEIMIAILFFMLSATVLIRVFGAARMLTAKSGVETAAVRDAYNVADRIGEGGAVEDVLSGMGFRKSHGSWSADRGEYMLYVTGTEKDTGAGTLWKGEVEAYYVKDVSAGKGGEALFALSCAHYEEKT